ncbi:hypothetical protein [Philodulcilactobacillus myokoensis]|nr:hypothetical protein [Philodulcilactobacillus myokoensis]
MGDNDYYPKATLNDNIVQYIINNKESNINNVNFNNYGNGVIHFDNQQNNKYVVLPYLYYNGINYDVSINNKHYKIHHDQNSLLKVLNFPKGKGIIIVKSNIMLTNILCI